MQLQQQPQAMYTHQQQYQQQLLGSGPVYALAPAGIQGVSGGELLQSHSPLHVSAAQLMPGLLQAPQQLQQLQYGLHPAMVVVQQQQVQQQQPRPQLQQLSVTGSAVAGCGGSEAWAAATHSPPIAQLSQLSVSVASPSAAGGLTLGSAPLCLVEGASQGMLVVSAAGTPMMQLQEGYPGAAATSGLAGMGQVQML